MEQITVLGKTFQKLISESAIKSRISEMANRINSDLQNQDIVFITVLNGAFIFAADLIREINLDCKVTFIKVASYQGTNSTGEVKELIGVNEDLTGKTLVILEDIIDTGITIDSLITKLNTYNPATIKVATLIFKKDAFVKSFKIDYIGFEIPNKFVIGYGLDYNGFGRNFKDIYAC